MLSFLGEEVMEKLKNIQWVWHGDGFAKINEVTSKNRIFAGRKEIHDRGGLIDFDLKPYVYPVCIMWS